MTGSMPTGIDHPAGRVEGDPAQPVRGGRVGGLPTLEGIEVSIRDDIMNLDGSRPIGSQFF